MSVIPLLLLLGLSAAGPAARPVGAPGEGPDEGTAAVYRLTAFGRSGHGSSLNLHTAPHRLVRAVAGLLEARDQGGLSASLTVLRLEAGTAINMIPEKAVAEILVDPVAGAEPELLEGRLRDLVGPGVHLHRFDETEAVGSGPPSHPAEG